MILLSHPTGNQFVREATRALDENGEGLLSEFWTSVCWDQQNALTHLLPRSVIEELGRRSFVHISRGHVRCHPWPEIGRLTAQKLKLFRFLRHETGIFCLDAVFHSLDSKVAARLRRVANLRGVYAYEDGALATFRMARQLGLKTIYELPIGYWKCYRELIQEEVGLQPEWAATLQGRADSDDKLRRKDEELDLATDIIVPSDFVRQTLRHAGSLKARITVLPYGAPPVARINRAENNPRDGKLKVLFAGALSQRKGLSYLLQAIARLDSHVELTLIGRKPDSECSALNAALRTHRWIPSLPHADMLDEMSRHDVMVFPTLFEGFALVVLEAMSQGVPVITTPNSGALNTITDGEDGFIVPIRDVDSIVEKLEALIRDSNRLAAMRQAAIAKAGQHSWARYRSRFVATVRQALTRDIEGTSAAPQFSHLQVCSVR